MLRRLTIRSFALIDAIDLDIESGMTVLLGETGAGKSIIVDALAAALGERLSSDSVRLGAKKAVIEATFDVASTESSELLLRQHDLEWDSNELVLRRELTISGTSRCFVNDTPAQAGIVREIANGLIDFHGQHDTQGLLNVARHRDVLDASAVSSDLAREMALAWDACVQAWRHSNEIAQRAKTADADRARLVFIRDEIETVNPHPGEDEQITADLLRAESSEHVIVLASRVRDALYAGDASAFDALQQARDALLKLIPFQADLAALLVDLEGALVACKETAASVAPLAEHEDFSPDRLEDLRQRQVKLQRLIRKYNSLDAARTEHTRVLNELALIENLDDARSAAEQAEHEHRSQAETIARKISGARKKQAPLLSSSIASALEGMGMPSATFSVEIVSDELGPFGSDHVEFMFSSNAGEPLRPLAKVASGGELSRVMLAVKKALAEQGRTGTMVFDEIDTGISGRVARTVGDVMKHLSKRQQIVCITHLAQIASLADNFVRVVKSESSGSTTVSAETISHELALVEVAKLLSGAEVTDVSLSGASELMTKQKAPPTRTKR